MAFRGPVGRRGWVALFALAAGCAVVATLLPRGRRGEIGLFALVLAIALFSGATRRAPPRRS